MKKTEKLFGGGLRLGKYLKILLSRHYGYKLHFFFVLFFHLIPETKGFIAFLNFANQVSSELKESLVRN